MATTKNLCAQIPIDLHERVSEERERLGQTTSEYIANLIQDYYNMMENQKGGIQMTEKSRTMAFQIPEELFQRIKRHLERETLRTGKKLTQRDFVLNLITQALDEADAENATEQNAPNEAHVAPRVAATPAPPGTATPPPARPAVGAAGRAGCALRCGLGLLDGQCNLAIRRDGDDLNLNGLASFQHGSKVLHKLIAYLRNVNKAGFAFRQGNEGAKRLNAGNFAFQDVSNL